MTKPTKPIKPTTRFSYNLFVGGLDRFHCPRCEALLHGFTTMTNGTVKCSNGDCGYERTEKIVR